MSLQPEKNIQPGIPSSFTELRIYMYYNECQQMDMRKNNCWFQAFRQSILLKDHCFSVCPSVRPSVRQAVLPSVRRSVNSSVCYNPSVITLGKYRSERCIKQSKILFIWAFIQNFTIGKHDLFVFLNWFIDLWIVSKNYSKIIFKKYLEWFIISPPTYAVTVQWIREKILMHYNILLEPNFH